MATQEVYKQLLEVMKKRRGGYSGMDIPEFYALVEELFTPEEAGGQQCHAQRALYGQRPGGADGP